MAQTPLVTGRVTNSNGEPVSFATVKIKGTPMSAAADVDGVFKIKATAGQVLVFTAANYASQGDYGGQSDDYRRPVEDSGDHPQ